MSIKEHGGSGMTKQREAVLQVILDSEEHLNANEVFDNARKLLPTISFATVYNSLRYLKNAGLINEIRFGNNATLYDRNLMRHDHAICQDCGKLVDLELEIPEKFLNEAAKRSHFKPESIEFTLRGSCPDCVDRYKQEQAIINDQ
ncbi:Fur family transcriptional regulator [Leptolyngbya sp. 7M]|uniref:Fur family transcriptional regulator n=1 Tax=Leptolyngbya sp. 7M TaxID=2812896 RepID=UPI001B8C5A98|nr:transcriptional repressor [Leptolyngbya sp. 7M]QYO67766.1 transcriptional repressor [Leptolyngbya sp. 7M]